MKTSNTWGLTVFTMGFALTLAVSGKAVSSETVPNFTVTTLDGKTITKASLEGKPTLLMFWASWCDTCQHELPKVKTLYEQNKAKGLQTVAIGFQDREANIRKYVRTHPTTFSFPTAYDAGDRVSTLFRAHGTPTFVLLDAQGRVVLIHTGGGILQNSVFQQFIRTL